MGRESKNLVKETLTLRFRRIEKDAGGMANVGLDNQHIQGKEDDVSTSESKTYIGSNTKTKVDMNKIKNTKIGDDIHYYVNGVEGRGIVVKMGSQYLDLFQQDGNVKTVNINDTFFVKDILLNKQWDDMDDNERYDSLQKIHAPTPRYIVKSWSALPEEIKDLLRKDGGLSGGSGSTYEEGETKDSETTDHARTGFAQNTQYDSNTKEKSYSNPDNDPKGPWKKTYASTKKPKKGRWVDPVTGAEDWTEHSYRYDREKRYAETSKNDPSHQAASELGHPDYFDKKKNPHWNLRVESEPGSGHWKHHKDKNTMFHPDDDTSKPNQKRGVRNFVLAGKEAELRAKRSNTYHDKKKHPDWHQKQQDEDEAKYAKYYEMREKDASPEGQTKRAGSDKKREVAAKLQAKRDIQDAKDTKEYDERVNKPKETTTKPAAKPEPKKVTSTPIDDDDDPFGEHSATGGAATEKPTAKDDDDPADSWLNQSEHLFDGIPGEIYKNWLDKQGAPVKAPSNIPAKATDEERDLNPRSHAEASSEARDTGDRDSKERFDLFDNYTTDQTVRKPNKPKPSGGFVKPDDDEKPKKQLAAHRPPTGKPHKLPKSDFHNLDGTPSESEETVENIKLRKSELEALFNGEYADFVEKAREMGRSRRNRWAGERKRQRGGSRREKEPKERVSFADYKARHDKKEAKEQRVAAAGKKEKDPTVAADQAKHTLSESAIDRVVESHRESARNKNPKSSEKSEQFKKIYGGKGKRKKSEIEALFSGEYRELVKAKAFRKLKPVYEGDTKESTVKSDVEQGKYSNPGSTPEVGVSTDTKVDVPQSTGYEERPHISVEEAGKLPRTTFNPHGSNELHVSGSQDSKDKPKFNQPVNQNQPVRKVGVPDQHPNSYGVRYGLKGGVKKVWCPEHQVWEETTKDWHD